MEEEQKGDIWKCLKQTKETEKAAKRAVCGNGIMRTHLKRHLSETASYKNRIDRDSMFPILKYDKRISNNTMNTDVEKEEKNI